MIYNFEIVGKPCAKGRPRLGKYGTYTPSKTENYENLVKYSFLNKYRDFKPIINAVKVEITAIFEVPKSYSKKMKNELEKGKEYTHKPDIDNITKIVLDSLNGFAYKDDNQVSNLIAYKKYGEVAKVIVKIEEIKEEE